MSFTGRPNPDFAPAYASYYFELTNPHVDLLLTLQHNLEETMAFIRQIPPEKANFQYADDKWTLKNVILHTIETERVFQYRALAISHKDQTNLPGFDENTYAEHNNYYNRELTDLVLEFETVRRSTISLFQGMSSSMLDTVGTANGSPVTPRNIGWMIIGHTIHHCGIIQERYLVDFDEI